MHRKFRIQPQVESLESRDVPSAAESNFSALLADGTTATGEFSTPSAVDPSQQFQSLSLSNLTLKINGCSATVSGSPTAEFAYGDLLGVTATASLSGTTVQIDDANANDGGADAQIGYSAGSAIATVSGSGGLGGGGFGDGLYGSISGIVWEDSNGDGTLDSGESGINGVEVELLSTSGLVEQSTTTNSTGAYSFTDVPDAQYEINVVTTEAFTQPGLGASSTTGSVFDAGSGMTAVTLTNGEAVTGLDAGLYSPVTVEGTVFVDAYNSGHFESPDAVLAGDTINLENSSGTVLATTTSGSSGAYEFTGLAAGTYEISVGEPLGYQFTTENATGNPSVDSGVNQLTGVSSTITLTDGASAATINAGLTVESGTASIGGKITLETAGTSGLTMQLIDPATGTALQTTTTDSSGDYSFSNLVAGSYSVTVQTNENIATGGDFDSSTYSAALTLASGQTSTAVNAELEIPQQFAFELTDGNTGTISYSIPYNQIDSTQAYQTIALTDFTMTVAGQTFSEGSTSFSTSPYLQYSYGKLTGIEFGVNTSGISGFSYTNINALGFTLSASNGFSSATATLKAINSGGLDFSQCYPNQKAQKAGDGKGTIDEGTLIVTVTVTDNNGNQSTLIAKVTFNQAGASAAKVAQAIAAQLNSLLVVSAESTNAGTVQIIGNGTTLDSVTVSLPGGTVNLITDQSGDCSVTIK